MRNRRAWRRLQRRMVIVNHVNGREAFRGVLWRVEGDFVLLRNAELREVGSNAATPLDGEVLLERSVISFYQLDPAPDLALAAEAMGHGWHSRAGG
jgi:hypothetical protein